MFVRKENIRWLGLHWRQRGRGRPAPTIQNIFDRCFYINCTDFVRDTFWGGYIGGAAKGTKFGDANYEIAHAFDDKLTSA